ncbi:MAG: hypothetical protein V4555_15805 [Acidobacteriota bacterium]
MSLLRKRTLIPLLIALAVIASIGVALFLRAKAPPEAARLLPESDAIIYIHLKTVREATHFDTSPVTRSPDFQHFIDATGIVPERDLDSVAFALHRMPDPRGPNGPVAYSEVFTGPFDGQRLATYLASIASAQESYAGAIIYTIPIEGRSLRIAQLGYDTIAASNMPTAEQVHSMIDRSRASALGTPGSSLLARYFHQVPLLSQAWGIGHIGLPFSQNGFISLFGLQLPLPEDTDLVASLRFTTSAHLRVEEFAPNPTSAANTTDALNTLLGILRGIATAQPPHNASDAALRAIIDSVVIDHHDSHADLNATATVDQLKALTTAHDPTTEPPPAPPQH